MSQRISKSDRRCIAWNLRNVFLVLGLAAAAVVAPAQNAVDQSALAQNPPAQNTPAQNTTDKKPEGATSAQSTSVPESVLTYVGQFSSDVDLKEAPTRSERAVQVLSGRGRDAPYAMVHPEFVALDSQGRVLVTDPAANTVHIFDLEQRQYSRIQDLHRLQAPAGVAVDNADNIYITDSKAAVIFVYDRRGKFRRSITGLKNESGSLFGSPGAIAIDKQANHIYVADPARDRVYVLNMYGDVLQKLGKGSGGKEPGEFNFPSDIAIRNGEVYIADSGNLRIQVFGPDGTFRRQIHLQGTRVAPTQPIGLATTPTGELIISDASPNTLQVLKSDGSVLGSIGALGSGPGQFEWPRGVCADGSGLVYVADADNHRVQIFRRTAAAK